MYNRYNNNGYSGNNSRYNGNSNNNNGNNGHSNNNNGYANAANNRYNDNSRYNNNSNNGSNGYNSNSNNSNSNNSNNGSNSSGSFENNPKLRNIDPMKIKIIMEIKEQSKHKSMEELLPEIMKINQELNRRQMSFTKNESELLLDAIEESLSPAERQKFQMIKSFMSIS